MLPQDPEMVKKEMDKLFEDIDLLIKSDLNPFEVFYYAAFIHLVFVKIHPFQDGNGRTARLMEKWFLIEKIGQIATSVSIRKELLQQDQKLLFEHQKTWVRIREFRL